MARFSKLGLLVKANEETAKTLIELVMSQEKSLKAAATKFGVSTQTLRQLSEKCGISVRAADVDLDAFVADIAASYAVVEETPAVKPALVSDTPAAKPAAKPAKAAVAVKAAK